MNDHCRRTRSVLAFVVLPAAFLLLGGCATTETVQFDPTLKREFPVRPAPAAVTRDSEQALSGKGYVKLGNISLTEDSQECENDQCTPVAHDENLEMRVRREAARRGGDAVRLERENVAGGTTRYKEGECIATGTRTVYVTERKCSRYSSTGTCANWVDSGYRTETEKVCTSRARIAMTTRTLTTSGTVWRHEPERVARDNAYIRALTRGSRAEVEQLIAQGAPITADLLVTADSPLFLAGQAGNVAAVALLLDKGVPLMVGHFTMAADAGQVEVLKLLLSRGVDIDAFDDVGYTALHRAAGSGRTEAVRLLLDRGARINLPDKDKNYGWTALTWAAGSGHVAVARLLLDRGADVNSTSATGRTPLMNAAGKGSVPIVKALLAGGARTDMIDKDGDDALAWACIYGATEAAKLLVAHGMPVDHMNSDSRTGLMWAAHNGHPQTVRALLSLGANRNLKSKNGNTAADQARLRLDHKDTNPAKKPDYRAVLQLLGQ